MIFHVISWTFLNVTSLPKNIEEYKDDFITSNRIDVLCFAETRLCDLTYEHVNIQNYNMFVSNSNWHGGGMVCCKQINMYVSEIATFNCLMQEYI